MDKALWKNIGYDFDWNQVNDNIDESDDLYVAAKKYIGRGGAKGVGGVQNDKGDKSRHKDHFHARLTKAGKGRFDLTYAEKYWPSDVSGEKEEETNDKKAHRGNFEILPWPNILLLRPKLTARRN